MRLWFWTGAMKIPRGIKQCLYLFAIICRSVRRTIFLSPLLSTHDGRYSKVVCIWGIKSIQTFGQSWKRIRKYLKVVSYLPHCFITISKGFVVQICQLLYFLCDHKSTGSRCYSVCRLMCVSEPNLGDVPAVSEDNSCENIGSIYISPVVCLLF